MLLLRDLMRKYKGTKINLIFYLFCDIRIVIQHSEYLHRNIVFTLDLQVIFRWQPAAGPILGFIGRVPLCFLMKFLHQITY